jgi:hypothetical protein
MSILSSLLASPLTFSDIAKNLCRGATSARIVALFGLVVDPVRKIGRQKLLNRDRAKDVIAECIHQRSDNRPVAFAAKVEKT